MEVILLLLEYFAQYIKITRGVTDSTVNHYITGLNTLNSLLKKYKWPITDVFTTTTKEELDSIKLFVLTNSEFINKDTVGNRMYSAAFNHFYRFACEDVNFFKTRIGSMDIVVPVSKQVVTTQTGWLRNQLIVEQVIESADYCCENNTKHETFIAQSTGKRYMEGHHLIPMKYQTEFNFSIDVYANIISLCPNCHKLLHYGIMKEKIYTLEKIYNERAGRLRKSGIDISQSDFIKLIG